MGLGLAGLPGLFGPSCEERGAEQQLIECTTWAHLPAATFQCKELSAQLSCVPLSSAVWANIFLLRVCLGVAVRAFYE